MYLSKVLLKGEQFRNPYEIHRALWAAFPKNPEQTRDFLFRVEQHSTRRVQILMQSKRKPEIDTASQQLLISKEINLSLIQKSQLRFLLVANPVKTIIDQQGRLNRKGEAKKCRVPLIKEEDQITWLKRKLDGSALINQVEVEKQLPLHFRKNNRQGKIQQYSFKGVLTVADATALNELMQSGIGPAKAFGCGLISFARG